MLSDNLLHPEELALPFPTVSDAWYHPGLVAFPEENGLGRVERLSDELCRRTEHVARVLHDEGAFAAFRFTQQTGRFHYGRAAVRSPHLQSIQHMSEQALVKIPTTSGAKVAPTFHNCVLHDTALIIVDKISSQTILSDDRNLAGL